MSIKALLLSLSILLALASTTVAQTSALASQADSTGGIVGKWTGTFEGTSSGNLELNLAQNTGKQLTGQAVIVLSDGTRYSTDLKTVAIKNGKLAASYTDPDGDLVTFTGTYSQINLQGTWEANGGQATGTWQVNRAAR